MNLPTDLVKHAFGFLSLREVAQLACVNKALSAWVRKRTACPYKAGDMLVEVGYNRDRQSHPYLWRVDKRNAKRLWLRQIAVCLLPVPTLPPTKPLRVILMAEYFVPRTTFGAVYTGDVHDVFADVRTDDIPRRPWLLGDVNIIGGYLPSFCRTRLSMAYDNARFVPGIERPTFVGYGPAILNFWMESSFTNHMVPDSPTVMVATFADTTTLHRACLIAQEELWVLESQAASVLSFIRPTELFRAVERNGRYTYTELPPPMPHSEDGTDWVGYRNDYDICRTATVKTTPIDSPILFRDAYASGVSWSDTPHLFRNSKLDLWSNASDRSLLP